MEDKPNVFPDRNNSGPQKTEPEVDLDKLNSAEEQMRLRREEEMKNREAMEKASEAKPLQNNISPVVDIKPQKNMSPLTEPDFDSDYDLVTLPSEGKCYKNKKSAFKLSYMNAADENILTNPNLLKSGKFLEVLITRKVLEVGFNYRDLLVGDRDAIMIWLRATGYGNTYPIQVVDPKTLDEFTTDIDLSTLHTKKLGAEPDEEGLFDFKLPISGKSIKFKFLTVGDVEEMEEHSEMDNNNYDLATYMLEKQIVEVEGQRETKIVSEFIKKMRIGDSRAFKKYVASIECGIDLNLKVQTPGGGQIETYFPLNSNFFWPEL
jgi:hypothetical protein